jgi:hypothetical protein
MKIGLTIVLGICFIHSAFAQFAIPQTTKINTPYGPASITTYTYTHQPFYPGGGIPVKTKYALTAILKDSTTLESYTSIDFDEKQGSIVFKNKKEKSTVTPNQTIELFRTNSEGRKYIGIPADSCWLFLCTKGKINTYSNLPELNIKFAIAVQKGDGLILPITKQNLIEMVGDHKKALALIEKKQYIKAVKAFNSNFQPGKK